MSVSRSASRPAVEDPLFGALRARVLHRGGKNGIRELALRLGVARDSIPVHASAVEFRQALRNYGASMPDEDFARLVPLVFAGDAADGQPSVDLTRFVVLLRGTVAPRRATIIETAFKRLDRENAGTVLLADLHEFYDVSRHPDVVGRKADAESILNKFLQHFTDETNPAEFVTHEEWINYYTGCSAFLDDDTQFELFVMRSWNLDRHQLVRRADIELTKTQLVTSAAARNHPLYQTSAQNFGKSLDQAFDPITKFHKAGAFTKANPSPGPSSSLNTSVTRSKYM